MFTNHKKIKIHNQNIYNIACADLSCKEDVIAFFATPPSREIGMHEGWGHTERETQMDVFFYDVCNINI